TLKNAVGGANQTFDFFGVHGHATTPYHKSVDALDCLHEGSVFSLLRITTMSNPIEKHSRFR
ncbi:hypothetical protein, partial [Pseudomonas syringae group genomosp. 3]|uniref:hypothetical protein n=1 Tax=Pseudomonas syringae group genomosp. 3 TaxID=251701 RepID=UPI001C3F15E8